MENDFVCYFLSKAKRDECDVGSSVRNFIIMLIIIIEFNNGITQYYE